MDALQVFPNTITSQAWMHCKCSQFLKLMLIRGVVELGELVQGKPGECTLTTVTQLRLFKKIRNFFQFLLLRYGNSLYPS